MVILYTLHTHLSIMNVYLIHISKSTQPRFHSLVPFKDVLYRGSSALSTTVSLYYNKPLSNIGNIRNKSVFHAINL